MPAMQNGFAVFTHPLFLADHVDVARIGNGNADETGCGNAGAFLFRNPMSRRHFYGNLR